MSDRVVPAVLDERAGENVLGTRVAALDPRAARFPLAKRKGPGDTARKEGADSRLIKSISDGCGEGTPTDGRPGDLTKVPQEFICRTLASIIGLLVRTSLDSPTD